MCHVCDIYVTMQELDAENEHSNNDILALHAPRWHPGGYAVRLDEQSFRYLYNDRPFSFTIIYLVTATVVSCQIDSRMPIVKRRCCQLPRSPTFLQRQTYRTITILPSLALQSPPFTRATFIRSNGCPISVNFTHSKPERSASPLPQTTIIKQSATYERSYKFGVSDTSTPILTFILSCPISP
jgi:hypothetical protein